MEVRNRFASLEETDADDIEMVKLQRCCIYCCRLSYWSTTRYPQKAVDIE